MQCISQWIPGHYLQTHIRERGRPLGRSGINHIQAFHHRQPQPGLLRLSAGEFLENDLAGHQS